MLRFDQSVTTDNRQKAKGSTADQRAAFDPSLPDSIPMTTSIEPHRLRETAETRAAEEAQRKREVETETEQPYTQLAKIAIFYRVFPTYETYDFCAAEQCNQYVDSGIKVDLDGFIDFSQITN